MYPHTSNHQGYEPSTILTETSQRWGEPTRNIQISQKKRGERRIEKGQKLGVCWMVIICFCIWCQYMSVISPNFSVPNPHVRCSKCHAFPEGRAMASPPSGNHFNTSAIFISKSCFLLKNNHKISDLLGWGNVSMDMMDELERWKNVVFQTWVFSRKTGNHGSYFQMSSKLRVSSRWFLQPILWCQWMESPRISSGKKASHGRVLHNPITVKAIRQGLRYHKVEKRWSHGSYERPRYNMIYHDITMQNGGDMGERWRHPAKDGHGQFFWGRPGHPGTPTTFPCERPMYSGSDPSCALQVAQPKAGTHTCRLGFSGSQNVTKLFLFKKKKIF